MKTDGKTAVIPLSGEFRLKVSAGKSLIANVEKLTSLFISIKLVVTQTPDSIYLRRLVFAGDA